MTNEINPALKALVIILCGVIIVYYLGISSYVFFIIAMLLTFAILKYYKLLSIKSFSYYCILILYSIFLSSNISSNSIEYPNKYIEKFPAVIKGEVEKVIYEKGNYQKLIINGEVDAKFLPAIPNQRIILDIYNIPIGFKPSDKLMGNVKARFPRKKMLPNDFPEYNYCRSIDVNWIADCNIHDLAYMGRTGGINHYKEVSGAFINTRVEDIFSKRNSGIIKAVLTGNRTAIDKIDKDLFSKTGTAHLIAISGLHMGIISAMIYFMLGFVSSKWLKFAIFSILIILFVILTGYQPSALRASILAILILFIRTLSRKGNILNILSFAILLLISFNPKLILSAGFQMSVISVFGIIIIHPIIFKKVSLLNPNNNLYLNYILNSFSVSLAASIAISPIIAYYFGMYSVISPLANLFVIPLFSIAILFSVMALLLSFIHLEFGLIYSVTPDLLIDLSRIINESAILLPYSYIQSDSLILISLVISFGMVYLFMADSFKQLLFRITIIASVFVTILIFPPFSEVTNNIEVYSREKFVSVVVNNESTTDVMLFERKPEQFGGRDYSFEKYLRSSNNKFKFYVSGNSGLRFYENFNKLKNSKLILMDHKLQNQIIRKLNLEPNLVQRIEYDTKL